MASRLDEVRECVRTALRLSAGDAALVGPETTPLDLPQWNSLAHVQLVLELERVFGVTFEADEIASLASVAAIFSALDRRGLDA